MADILYTFTIFQLMARKTQNLEKLTTPEELSGLLNLALKGLHDLIAEGGFHHKTIEEIKQEYEENTSDVNAFLIQECVVDTSNPEYCILTDGLYASYVNLCE
jgi:putative DNA primase/helicase